MGPASTTPSDVARLMVRLAGLKNGSSVFDPCCGIGSILAAVTDEAKQRDLAVHCFGQESDVRSFALATLRFFFCNPKATLRLADALHEPASVRDGRFDTFDRVLCHPPIGLKPRDKDLMGSYAWLATTLGWSSRGTEKKKGPMVSTGTGVFIVHGHNNALNEACARLLERQGLRPIILREPPNRGRTIIEKFESHTDVAFAVVLVTGDDEGRKAAVPAGKLAARARQNVIFELGFFLGRLGRDKVCAIYEPGAELPSDYNGMAYIEYDLRGAWRIGLLQELKAAGLPVNDMGLL